MDNEEIEQEFEDRIEQYIRKRELQLYGLMMEASKFSMNYLFLTNSGGAVAILAHLSSFSDASLIPWGIKIALCCFFMGIVFVGIFRALETSRYVFLFNQYQILLDQYYKQDLEFDDMYAQDKVNVGDPKLPYYLAYGSFGLFIIGCMAGASSLFCIGS